MDPVTAENAIAEAFLKGSSLPDDRIALDNQKFEPPKDLKPWARISIQHNDGEQAAIGPPPNQLFRRVGLLFVQVFVASGSATHDLNRLCYEALTIYEGQHIEGIWFRNGRISYVPAQEEKWYQRNVVIEFEYDDIH